MNAVQVEQPVARSRVERAGSGLRIGVRNVRGGLVLVSIGFLAGLAMSLYAFQPVVQPGAALDQYDDLPRRLLRLAHIAAIMLPLINIVFGTWLDRLRLSHGAKEWASRLLLAGLAMSLYAFQPVVQPGAALDQYDDLPRRLLRLAHIAAIMLPLINIVFGTWLDRLRLSTAAKEWASRLLLAGAVAVPLALALEAISAPARAIHLSALPVLGFCSGIFIVSFGAARTRF